jgi:hypothetical protein
MDIINHVNYVDNSRAVHLTHLISHLFSHFWKLMHINVRANKVHRRVVTIIFLVSDHG